MGSPYADFLIRLAGHDSDLLHEYLKHSERPERIRLVQLGISLFLPALIGLFSFSNLVSKITDSAFVMVTATLGYATVIFFIDRYFVLSIRKSDKTIGIWPVFLRVVLAICIGFVVSEPIIVKLFEKSIDKELTAELAEEKADKNGALTTKRLQLVAASRTAEDLISKLQEKRAAADLDVSQIDEQIKKLQLDGRTNNSTNAANAEAAINAEAARANNLLASISKMDAEISATIVKMQLEFDGQGDTKLPNKGPEWKRLGAIKEQLINQRTAATRELNRARANVADLGNKRQDLLANANNPNASQIQSLEKERLDRLRAHNPGANTAATKEYDLQIAAEQKELSSNRDAINKIDAELNYLHGSLQLADRDDMLSRSKALWVILSKDNNTLAWAIFGALMIAFMVADTAPIITKLSFRSIADDTVRHLEAEDGVALQEKLAANRLARSIGLEESQAREAVNTFQNISSELLRLGRIQDENLSELAGSARPKEELQHAMVNTFRDALGSIMSKVGSGNMKTAPDVDSGQRA